MCSSRFTPERYHRIRVSTAKLCLRSWLCRCRHKHDLRHSYATGALKAGVSPKVVSERIGHANVGFFLETYAHVLKNDDRDAAEQAASFLISDGWDSESDDERG